jgi:gluconokinase
MNNYPLVLVVGGLSGSGKTTIGRRLSQHLECHYIEGDRLHPKENIAKMANKQPLEDEDRELWLAKIESKIQEAIDQNQELVITCSALKAKYRQRLNALGSVQLIWIAVPFAILEQRLTGRRNHFFSAEMLPSQIKAFEPITPAESVISINGSNSIDEVMGELKTKLIQQYPALNKPWWERGME